MIRPLAMKQTILAALLFLNTCCAFAVRVADDRKADLLVIPYVTSLDGFETLLTVSNNNTEAAIAVQVVMREASGNDFAFNAYLSPGSSLAAAVSSGDLILAPESCAVGEGFEVLAQTIPLEWSEGYVEVYEMGSLLPDDASNTTIREGCIIAQPWLFDWEAPRGNLSAVAHLISDTTTTSFSQPALGFADFSATSLHADPQAALTLLDVNPLTADLLKPDGESVITTWSTPFDTMSAVLASVKLESDYSIEPEIGGRTELILTSPLADYMPPTPTAAAARMFVSGRNRDGSIQKAVSKTASKESKCNPTIVAKGMLPGQRIDRTYLGSTAVFSGDSREAIHTSPIGNECGYTTGRPFPDMRRSGRVYLYADNEFHRELRNLRSLEGVEVSGYPVILSSLTLLTRVGREIGLVNPVRRTASVLNTQLLLSARQCSPVEIDFDRTQVVDDGRGLLRRLDGQSSLLDQNFSPRPLPSYEKVLAYSRSRSWALVEHEDGSRSLFGFSDPSVLTLVPGLPDSDEYLISENGGAIFGSGPFGSSVIYRYNVQTDTVEELDVPDISRPKVSSVQPDGRRALVVAKLGTGMAIVDFDSKSVTSAIRSDEDRFRIEALDDPLDDSNRILWAQADISLERLHFAVLRSETIFEFGHRLFVYSYDRTTEELSLLNPKQVSILFRNEFEAPVFFGGESVLTGLVGDRYLVTRGYVAFGDDVVESHDEGWQLFDTANAMAFPLRFIEGDEFGRVIDVNVTRSGSTLLALFSRTIDGERRFTECVYDVASAVSR